MSSFFKNSRWRYVGHKRSLSSRMTKDQVPGVTIIRPLRGIDCNMYENLASSFRQDYPLFEIVFSVAQANDPAIAVVKDLMKKYPKVDARLIIGKQASRCARFRAFLCFPAHALDFSPTRERRR
jgi:cellulose synthase/poly-beta-1,6-N-acetylglucosamine synthase-like glycosyltransferase